MMKVWVQDKYGRATTIANLHRIKIERDDAIMNCDITIAFSGDDVIVSSYSPITIVLENSNRFKIIRGRQ